MEWAFLGLLCFRGVPRISILVLPRCFPGSKCPKIKGSPWLASGLRSALSNSLKIKPAEYAVWDATMRGFGVRVRPTGAMSYVVVYRAAKSDLKKDNQPMRGAQSAFFCR